MGQSKNFVIRNQLDYLNILLMGMCWAIAYLIPWPMLLGAYALLGPAHYLTQISWLHDHHYFAKRRYDFLPLVVTSFILAAILLVSDVGIHLGFLRSTFQMLLIFALVFSISAAFLKSISWRFVVIPITFGIYAFIEWNPFSLMLLFLVPTVIHVYCFTACFILNGALKNKSWLGLASFLILFGCGFSFYLFTPYLPLELGSVEYKQYFFSGLAMDFMNVLGIQITSVHALMTIKFLAFAYSYHYLNWFSKTQIIGWHKISSSRKIWIVMVYVVSICLYAFNYKLGLIALGSLSIAHVILEFPLDALVIKNLGEFFLRKLD